MYFQKKKYVYIFVKIVEILLCVTGIELVSPRNKVYFCNLSIEIFN